MTPLQQKYNLSYQRAIELINLVDKEFKTMSSSEVDAEFIIKRCKITAENEKECIREVIENYLKAN